MDALWPEKTWTARELMAHFPNCETLSQVTATLTNVAREQGAVICQVIVNGMILTEEQEIRFKDTPVSEIESYSIKVQNVSILLDESLVGCRQYLVKLAESMDKASELFRVEDLSAAQKYYQACLDGTGLFVDMAKHLKVVFENERGTIPFDWPNYENGLAAVLGQILDAYKKRNYILVADLLEYDLVDLLNRWQEELAKLERNKAQNGGTVAQIET